MRWPRRLDRLPRVADMTSMTIDLAIRLGVFAGVFVLMALWEQRAPMRALVASRPRRWVTNWAISISDAVMVRLVFGAAAIGAAADAEARGWGLFNELAWPLWAEVLIAFLIFDFAIWLQHLIMHKVPVLWRVHRVHHADRDIDVTTGIRFHPIEIAVSMSIKIGLVYLIGAPVLAVIVFEIVLNGLAMFNHSNVELGTRLDARLRRMIVTPDMHRVHHSVDRREHDANYGFNLSLWDRLFRTYVAQPGGGHRGMTVGLSPHQDDRPTRLGWSLALPFHRLDR